MTEDKAAHLLHQTLKVTREEVTRAKTWLREHGGGRVDDLAAEWLATNSIADSETVDTDSPMCVDQVRAVAAAIAARLSLYQATWELIAASELLPSGSTEAWRARFGWKSRRGGSPIQIEPIECPRPAWVHRSPAAPRPTADVDVFLAGAGCDALHPGIVEGVRQSLSCFARGLYMPATVMLAAAVEATWSECGRAMAAKLPAASKLAETMADPRTGIAKRVIEIRKTLDRAEAKAMLAAAGVTLFQVDEAVTWTDVLRDSRNALHWDKANGFVADHGKTAGLLMSSPTHLSTLEAIRTECSAI